MSVKVKSDIYWDRANNYYGIKWAGRMMWYESLEVVRELAREEAEGKKKEISYLVEELNKKLSFFNLPPINNYPDFDVEILENLIEMSYT